MHNFYLFISKGEVPAELLEFAPHLKNKHEKVNNAQQYYNSYDKGYRYDNKFQKISSYDEKLIDELIDEYLKESQYDDSSKTKNGKF